MRIGLFGGSFNPAHAGHLLVAQTALRRLSLDRVWWMVTPGNPLKDRDALRPLAERIAASRALTRDPRILVTAFEARHGRTYTADTLEMVLALRPGVSFVWIMGADSLAGFHHWRHWPRIARTLPICVVDRPGGTLSPLHAPMARAFARHRLREERAALLPSLPPPAWVFLHGPRSPLSSTALRPAT
ncbi:nicotinate-nucleotide adenylyltransferase [Aureimonas populi]|nr:nicotinate-nucleotide adenylyltransferase [Aureimonas populi]